MPRPTDRNATYLPGLDGVRALAVGAVVAYHLGVPGLTGGLLGVGVFFTLSGFLITSLLLSGWEKTGRVGLGTFWLRRARRLLPAVVVLLLTVLVATAVVDPASLSTRFAEAAAASLYVSNWAAISGGQSYFNRFTGPGPLDHLWSLAVEEQFYAIWPLALLLLVVVLGGRLRRVAWLTLALALLSFAAMAMIASPGFDNTRAYDGTDTRAGGLLVGAAVALVWRPGRMPLGLGHARRVGLDLAGVGGLVGIGLLFARTDEASLGIYRGGILVLSLASVVLVAVVCHPESLLGRALGMAPLRWVGERSYGI